MRYGIRCRQLVELITDYLEGSLPRRIRRRFEAHIEGCVGCRRVLGQMRETIRITGALTDKQIPEAYRGRLLATFADRTR